MSSIHVIFEKYPLKSPYEAIAEIDCMNESHARSVAETIGADHAFYCPENRNPVTVFQREIGS